MGREEIGIDIHLFTSSLDLAAVRGIGDCDAVYVERFEPREQLLVTVHI